MQQPAEMTFAFVVSPVSLPGATDTELYEEALADCTYGHTLGYEGVWALEHHFTDYFPTPDVLLFLAHVAATCPGLGLGTQVIVAPWHNPIRLTEQIAMLQVLSKGPLHLGLGRGTAKQEYDAFGLDMAEARGRFKEIIEIIRLGLSGAHFSYHGEYYQINDVCIRPQVGARKPHFYGAIGSLESATIMAELDLPPLCLLTFPDHLLQKILLDWELTVRAHGGDMSRPKVVSAKLYMADTDEAARELARQYMPAYFALQLDHYEAEADHWRLISGYEHHSKAFANLRKLTEPVYQERYFDMQFIGTADTVAAKVAKLQALGFTYITVGTGTPYVPRQVRHDMLRRFAEDVMPRFTGSVVRTAAEA